jgi:HEAT repeat protein
MKSSIVRSCVGGFALVLLLACQKKTDAPARDAGAAAGAQAIAALPAAPTPPSSNVITAEEYEKLLLGLSACSVVGRSIDPKCPARTAYSGIRSLTSGKRLPPGAQLADLAKKHMMHAAPAVRLAAAGLLRSFFGADAGIQQLVLDRIGKEEHGAVVARLLEVVGSRAGSNPAILELLLRKADDSNEIVRSAAVSWLASSWSKGAKGALDKVLERVEKDPSPTVRSLACRDVYKHEDARVIPRIEKLVGDPTIGASCLEGIVNLWAHFLVKNKSEAAYKKSLALLSKKPRDQKNPPWQVMSSLGRPTQAPWYDVQQVRAVLKDIAADKMAMWMARTGAVRALKDLKTDKSVFEALKRGYEGATGEHKLVLSQIEQALK